MKVTVDGENCVRGTSDSVLANEQSLSDRMK